MIKQRASFLVWKARKIGVILILAAISLLNGVRSQAQAVTTGATDWSRLDFRDVRGYRQRLQADKTPFAVSLRQQIAAGPSDRLKERRAARRAGMPLTMSELARQELAVAERVIPPKDAALVYIRINNIVNAKPLRVEFINLRKELDKETKLSEEQIAVLRREVEERRDLLDPLLQASARPYCVFEHRPENFPSSQGKQRPSVVLAKVGGVCSLLQAQSLLLAREGRYQEALEKALALFRIAQHALSEPTLGVVQSVGWNIDNIGIRATRVVLRLCGARADVARSVRDILVRNRPRYSLRMALRRETAEITGSMRVLRAGTPQFLFSMRGGEYPEPNRPAPPRFGPDEQKFVLHLLAAHEAVLLRRLRFFYAQVDRSDPRRLGVFEAALSRIANRRPSPLNYFEGYLSTIILDLPSEQALLEAGRSVVVTSASLLIHKARYGSFPDAGRPPSALQRDPFSGRSLGYRREGYGFVVFSVGQNRRFDGAPTAPSLSSRERYFRYAPETPIVRVDEEREESGRLILSKRDFARFVEVLNDPSPPTPNLVAAMRAYRQLKAEFPDNNL
ncbi:MAG TPA: DUF1778 domain-containing protein [Abditibacterium sp.]